MHTQYINEMLNIPEVKIHHILPMSEDEIYIEVVPVAQNQCCPICRSDETVLLKGIKGGKSVFPHAKRALE